MGECDNMPKPKPVSAPQKPSLRVKTPEQKAPEFTLKEASTGLELVIAVPGLASMQGVDLDVTERMASLAFPSSIGFKPLQVELPAEVVPNRVRAKFSKKNQQI